MNEVIEGWIDWLNAHSPRSEKPDPAPAAPDWLLRLAEFGGQWPAFLSVNMTRLIPPSFEAVAKAVAGESIRIAEGHSVETQSDYDIFGKLKGDALTVQGQPLDRWLEQHVAKDAKAPRELVAGAARARTMRHYFNGDFEAPKTGIRLAPGPIPDRPEAAQGPLSVTPYVVRHRRDDAEKIMLRGWWMTSAVTLESGEIAALTLARDEIELDRSHPDIKLTKAEDQFSGSGPIKASSHGLIHVVDQASRYVRGVRIDGELVEATRDGSLVFVRRAAFRDRSWGTTVFASKGGHLTPIAKLDADIGAVFEVDERIYGARGFEILGLRAALKAPKPWTPTVVDDTLALPNPPPAAAKVIAADGGALQLELSDASPSSPAVVQVDGADWVGDPGPTGAVVASTLTDGKYSLWVHRADGTRVDIEGASALAGFTYSFVDDRVFVSLGRQVVQLDLVTGEQQPAFTLGNTARDMVATTRRVWVLVNVNRADAELCRYELSADGWTLADRFPACGFDTLQVSPTGDLVALTINNAPPEVAFTLFVAVDSSGAHRYLGRLSNWASNLWAVDGEHYVQLAKGESYRLANLPTALAHAIEEEPWPFLALVYDVPSHYGKRELFPRYDADLAFVNEVGDPITRYAFVETFPFDGGHARARFRGGRYWGLIDRDGDTAMAPHYSWIGPADQGLRRVAIGDAEILAKAPSAGNWGLVSGTERVAECEYKMVRNPSGGVTTAETHAGEWFVLNAQGARIAGPFQGAASCSEGYLAAKTDDRWGFLNAAGEWVIEPQYTWAGRVSEGLVAVQVDGVWQFMDPATGELAFDGGFTQFGNFSHGVAVVARGSEWGFVNRAGEILGDGIVYRRTYNFIGGLGSVQVDGKRWAYMTAEGELLGLKSWTRTYNAEDGVGVFVLRGQTGYMRPDGSVIAKGMDAGYGFSGPVACAQKDGRWGVLDRQGEWVVKPTYAGAQRHSDGRAWVRVDGRWGCIDEAGEMLIEPKFGTPAAFSEGRCAVRK